MDYERMVTADREAARRQLGRELRGEARVAARCPHGVVEVIATSPLLDDGTPFPTLFWLTCPLLRRAVSGLESGDFRRALREKLASTPSFACALRRAELDYVAERERWAEEMGALERVRDLFAGKEGIGGTMSGGIKCLHAHLAHFLAGGDNPVGAAVARELGERQEEECDGDCAAFLGENGKAR